MVVSSSSGTIKRSNSNEAKSMIEIPLINSVFFSPYMWDSLHWLSIDEVVPSIVLMSVLARMRDKIESFLRNNRLPLLEQNVIVDCRSGHYSNVSLLK